MLKVLLKTIIFEIAINKLFDQLWQNFKVPVKLRFTSFALPIIRRAFPTLFSNNIAGIAIHKPLSISYALRFASTVIKDEIELRIDERTR